MGGRPVPCASTAGPYGQAWTPTRALAFLGRSSLGQSHALSWFTLACQHRAFQTRHQRPVAQRRLSNYSARLLVACTVLATRLFASPSLIHHRNLFGPACPILQALYRTSAAFSLVPLAHGGRCEEGSKARGGVP